MFKWLFIYWFNLTDSPSNTINLNFWSLINIRFFKCKISAYILYYILSLNNIQFKKIKIFYKILSFEYLYLRLLNLVLVFCLFITLFLI